MVGRRARFRGFTLVELVVSMAILGVLAAFGMPRVADRRASARASDALDYLTAVREAQERYVAKEATYAGDLALLDLPARRPEGFVLGTLTTTNLGPRPTWTLALVRDVAGSRDDRMIVTQDGLVATTVHVTNTW